LIDVDQFFQKIAKVSTKPVFANSQNLPKFVGGVVLRGFTQGYEAGLLALRLLRDPSKTDIKRINNVKDEYIFDYKQFKKYDIKESSLPPNSLIINKPIVEYGRYIALLLLAILVLSLIIVVLIILNRKRLYAEKKVKEQLNVINERNQLLEKSYVQLSDLNCELEEANAQLMSLNASLEDAKLKAEESEKLKSSFLANLSHEIRTPLNAILGFSSLLVESQISEKSKKNYNEIIQANSESLLVLIDDILDFSKIEAGQVKIQHEPVLINQILQELYDYFRHKANEKLTLKLSDKINKQQITIPTDKTRFKQILSNLLTNAFKFTEEGTIEMGYEIMNGYEIKFFVKDTGIGIDQKYHQAIFERFRKVENEHDRFYSGSGLGLAICKRLTELLGGKIWVEGDFGKGSCFCFTHPDYSILSNTYEEKSPQRRKVEYNWKGKKIAIAEDEENNYLLLERITLKYGAEVIWFRDGQEIVNYFSGLNENDIDLVMMDIKMPGMDGYEALVKIRALFPDVIVIAQTAHAMNEDAAIIRKKGFNDYLTKPLNIDNLREKLNKYLFRS
jgi:signal transduction histidine kinase/CheY-like chemotaxis protein